MQIVSSADEWCAEAYMETDYSTLSSADFEREIKKYLVFKIMNENPLSTRIDDDEIE
jgi:type I restriction enzyme M protein